MTSTTLDNDVHLDVAAPWPDGSVPGLRDGPAASRAFAGEDVRKRLDEAVVRGWAEIFRKVARVGTLCLADAVGSLLALALAFQAACGSLQGGNRRVSFTRMSMGIALAVAMVCMHSEFLVRPLPATLVLAYLLASLLLLYAGRRGVDGLVSVAQRWGFLTRRLLVVGSEEDTLRLRTLLPGWEGRDVALVERISPETVAQASAFDRLAGLETILSRNRAAGVLVAANLGFATLDALTQRCFELGATVAVVPQTLHQLGGELELRFTRAGTMIELRPRGLRFPQLALKRAIDLVACAIGLLLIWPLLVALAVAIKLDSRGPILFRQRRAGVGGRPFGMFKFRTMVVDADAMKAQLAHLNESGDPRLFKIRRDPRITRVGQFLRRSSLDELPQLFNVLRGEMSLVGPRPFFPEDLETYEAHHYERLFVLPGITGLWQVSGRSDVVDFEEVVRLDAEYIRNWSVGLDLSILFRTVPAALGRGAY